MKPLDHIMKAIRRFVDMKFTGVLTIEITLNEGGIRGAKQRAEKKIPLKEDMNASHV